MRTIDGFDRHAIDENLQRGHDFRIEVFFDTVVETRAAVNNLEEILAVKGISGVYVGPSDLSLSLGKPPTLVGLVRGSKLISAKRPRRRC